MYPPEAAERDCRKTKRAKGFEGRDDLEGNGQGSLPRFIETDLKTFINVSKSIPAFQKSQTDFMIDRTREDGGKWVYLDMSS